MPYQVDFWGGDMHTEEAGTLEFAGWAAAAYRAAREGRE